MTIRHARNKVDAFLNYWFTPERAVTVYEITRHYGGAEEGGWWYNSYEPVESIRFWFKVPRFYAQWVAWARALHTWEMCGYGDIYSMGGGCEYRMLMELNQHEMVGSESSYYE